MILCFGNKSKGNKLLPIVVIVNIAISQLKNYLPLKGQRNTCICLLVGGDSAENLQYSRNMGCGADRAEI